MLDLSGIEDGTFDGWNRKNGSDAMSIVEGEGLTTTSKALKFTVGSSVTAAHSVQLYTPDISAVSGIIMKFHFLSVRIKLVKPG